MRYVFLLFLFLVSPLKAAEIDYFCIFSNQAAALVDAPVAAFSAGGAFDPSTTFPGVSIVTPQALINGVSTSTGFWIIISRQTSNAALDADINCVMKLSRDTAAIGGNFVLAAAITGSNRTNLTFGPVPAGAKYPQPLGQ